jgi:hypothetical protein
MRFITDHFWAFILGSCVAPIAGIVFLQSKPVVLSVAVESIAPIRTPTLPEALPTDAHPSVTEEPSPSENLIPTPTRTPTPIPITKLPHSDTPVPSIAVSVTMTPSATPSPTGIPTTTVTPAAIPSITPTITAERVWATGQQLDGWFTQYANAYGIDREKLRNLAICETDLNQFAQNGDYVGLFQFSSSTWVVNRQRMGMDTKPDLRFNAEESIRTAAYKISQSGYAAWPYCSGKIG